MTQSTVVRQADPEDALAVSDILCEAAKWLRSLGNPLWVLDELTLERIAGDVAAGLYLIAERAGAPAGVVRFQLEDPLFWPDRALGEAAYVHRLAVRRTFAGSGVSTDLLHWASQRAAHLGRSLLRLDCRHDSYRLRAFYEQFGFKYHSDRQVGPYYVARYEYRIGTGSDNRTG